LSRKTATSAFRGLDQFEIKAPISSESFIAAQRLGVLEINSSESLVGSSSLFGDQLEAFGTDNAVPHQIDAGLSRGVRFSTLRAIVLEQQQHAIPLQ
jgi:hypothetical protein